MSELLVLIGSDIDLPAYARRYDAGGVPDRVPYGADRAPEGWSVRAVGGEGASVRGRRLSELAKRRTGADLPHAWRRRRELRAAAYVYAHSEIDYLAAAAVLRLLRARRPVLVGQTIWLFREWDRLPAWRRRLLRWCLGRVDVLVANARPNLDLGRALVPGARHVYVPFGVSPDFAAPVRAGGGDDPAGADGRPARGDLVLTVGNDRARDWATFLAAVELLPGAPVRIASGRSIPGAPDGTVRATDGVGELRELYATAGVLVVAVRENAHASGITTVLEAAAAGCPVVATRAGGLDAYFTDDEVVFVPEGDPAALAAAVRDLLADPAEGRRRGERLRAAFRDRGYDNASYWRRVVAELGSVHR